jgi:class 3 adenylate cyclase
MTAVGFFENQSNTDGRQPGADKLPEITEPGGGGGSAEKAEISADNDQLRRPVSALAIEIVVPERALEVDDPEEGLAAYDSLVSLACSVIERHGGTVTSRSEAVIVGTFGVRAAMEDHALQACRAALALRTAILARGDGQGQMYAGLDSGEAVVRFIDPGTTNHLESVGGVVRAASKIAQALRRNAIACTRRMSLAVSGRVTTARLTDTDFAIPLPGATFYEILEENRVISRWQLRCAKGLMPFTGRKREIETLSSLWQLVMTGAGQAVGLVAEAGVGKSRLIHEFLANAAGHGCRLCECGAFESDASSSLMTIKKLVRAMLQVEEGGEQAAAAARISSQLTSLGCDSAVRSALLFVLDLPVDDRVFDALLTPERARRVRNAVMGLLELLASQTPVILLVEDIHWIDAESEPVLGRLIDGIVKRRVLLITTYRPEYRHQWGSRSNFTQIHLSSLDLAETNTLLEAMLGKDRSVKPLIPLIVERTDGVPLFVEEMVQALVQSTTLTGSIGSYKASGEVKGLRVPATVQTLIAARIDRLARWERRVLKSAATIGREVPLDLLASMTGLDREATAESLSKLQDAGFLYEMQLLPTQIFIFKHALVQKVAYESIVNTDRKKLHARLVETVEHRLPHLLEDSIERLSEHAIEAECWDKAEKYLLRAAGRALQRSSHNLALSFLKKGLAILERRARTPERDRVEIEYQKLVGVACMAAKGWGAADVYSAYDRLEALSEAVADDSERFTALRGLAQYYMISGQPGKAEEVGRKFADLKRLPNDDGLAIEAHHVHWTNNFFMGNCLKAARHAEEAIDLYDPDTHHSLAYKYSGHDPGVCSLCFAGLSAWQKGELEIGADRCQQALDLAKKLSHPLTTALAYWGLSYFHIFRRQPQAAFDWAQLEIEICGEYMMPLLHSQGLFQAGWAMSQLGDRRGGIKQMQRGIAEIRSTGAEMGLPYLLGLLAEVLSTADEDGPAMELLEEAIGAASRNGSHFHLSELLRIKAETLSKAKNHSADQVESLFRQAIAVAEHQGAMLPALHSATRLADFLIRRRRRNQAAAVLAPYQTLMNRLGASADGGAVGAVTR